MTVIIVPTEACQFRCFYCFEPENQRKGLDIQYDIEAIKKSLDEIWAGPYGGSDLCLHGGEPTLIPRHDLRKLLEHIYKYKEVVNIVTNGYKLDDYTMALFKEYNVYVGLSCDGPPELNVLRGPNPSDPEITRQYNEKLQYTMKKLRQNNIWTSIMCILHKENASTTDKLGKLTDWMLELKEIGIQGGRTNLMYASPSQKHLELSEEEAVIAWKTIYEFNKKEKLRWNPHREMVKNLLGYKTSPCSFSQCNYFSTHTISVLPDGTVGNCDRTFSKGLYLRTSSGSNSGRYESLRQTQCKGCKFWAVCGGGCPMEGYDYDWRNKTRFCKVFYDMYQYVEDDIRGVFPDIVLVMDTNFDGNPFKNISGKIKLPEQQLPHNDSIHGDWEHGDGLHGDSLHGDTIHGDTTHGDSLHGDSLHGDALHGDAPHGDSSHGDRPDWVGEK